jgi:4-hydroxy-2-oxoheptanedioate aldolase
MVTEIMADADFDWVLIDCEHCPITLDNLKNILMALQRNDTVPVVRVLSNHPDHIKAALDLGAGGIMVPLVNTADDARQAVEATRYAPLGKRAFGPVRAGNYFKDFEDYIHTANQEIVLMAEIEDVEAIQSLDEIFSVEGVDGIFIGPGDLAQSLGHLGDTTCEEVQSAIQTIIDKANEAGFPWGTLTGSQEQFEKYIDQGGILTTFSGDLGFLMEGMRQSLPMIREVLTSKRTS